MQVDAPVHPEPQVPARQEPQAQSQAQQQPQPEVQLEEPVCEQPVAPTEIHVDQIDAKRRKVVAVRQLSLRDSETHPVKDPQSVTLEDLSQLLQRLNDKLAAIDSANRAVVDALPPCVSR
jgi:hypothetical protein